jgi:glycosyltransferase involved in cell wall biosynthesis
MNIWILNHYAGTAESPSTRHYDLSKELLKKGHSVTIFASGFNHYKFIEERLEPGEKWKTEDYDGVRFVWVRTFPYKGNEWRRVVNMLSYAWNVIWIGRGLRDKPDVIIGSCVHPFAVLSAYLLSKLKKGLFFFEVRDLWPQTLIDMGALREKSLVARGLYMMEKFLYKKAVKIITLLPHADQYITKLGIPKNKIVWIPNGADLRKYEDIKKYDGEISGPFKIMYLGAHGRVNALDVILDTARILQQRGLINVRFIFVGDGPEKASLMNYAKSIEVANVEFRDPVPKSEIYKVMGEADAFVVTLEDLPLYKYGISLNKLFDYLASGRPVLFSGNSANNPVEEAGAGISVPARNPAALAKAVSDLSSLTADARIRMGENGLNYIKKKHDIKLLATKLELALLK